MNFSYVEFPCTISLNAFKANFSAGDVILPRLHDKSLDVSAGQHTRDNDGGRQQQQPNQPESLRHLALDVIIANWNDNPIFEALTRQEDRNYILAHLDTQLPLKLLSERIRDDFFWRRCCQQRWKPHHHSNGLSQPQPWISIYMQRHLQEFIERVETCDYDREQVQAILNICAPYVNQMEIKYLKPAADGRNDHIPLDFVLSNLPELQTLRLTYATKTVGSSFCLGSNTLSQKDIVTLSRGLSQCHELVTFCLHSTKLESYQLPFLARALDKGCHKLTSLSIIHCSMRDAGIKGFLSACNKESFNLLEVLDLTDNRITSEGAYVLSRTMKGVSLRKLILRMNPIQSDGVAAIFSLLCDLPVETLDISGCSICQSITKLFMQLIIKNKALVSIDISNNDLGEEFGKQLYKIIGFNKVLQRLDLRNTGLSLELRNQIKEVLEGNKVKTKSYLKTILINKQ
ncbi:dynein regulatory complex subunit 5 [Bactrocera neohumeralis]|uniref:dynein regulatory complex subunit 5 n=1 Tax=Bactrocera neohumeralis TaxID=98809 RepID=UPI0021666001|nr:dynein regulatory complex subunit 5 [Bactrocera neohumeralis]